MNKQMKHFLWEYNRSSATTLSDCYKSCSKAKQEAYDNCLMVANLVNGKDIRIISHNTFSFSVGFVYDGLWGKTFVVITPNHKYTEIL